MKRVCCNIILCIVLVCTTKLAYAAVQGFCSTCHTMHNSQGGASMMWENTGPEEVLLRNTCVGCHDGDNDAISVDTSNRRATDAPFIMGSVEPEYNNTGTEADTTTLAGGNFWWVKNNDQDRGHNVLGIASADGTHGNTPPGADADLAGQLSCSGTNGCHGNTATEGQFASIKGAHHGNVGGTLTTANTVANSYRFLLGIKGVENDDWEWRPTAASHNHYKGMDRVDDTDADTSTISSLCARCHNDFHNEDKAGDTGIAGNSFASPWIRHPIDEALPTTSDYANYVDYSVISPVASDLTAPDLDGTSLSNSNKILMCLSCHRAHGTPYSGMLRWDYKSWPGAGGYFGCGVCHTSKN